MPRERFVLGGIFTLTCHDANGRQLWIAKAPNLITTEGINYLLDIMFPGGAGTSATLYVGMTDGTPTPAAGDTMSSHAGWAEVTAYSESVRQTYTDVRSSQTVSNTASKATYSMNASGTAGGAFLCTNSTKGGSTGTLVCVGAASGGDEAFADGNTIQVQYDFTGADDGV
jgi:hypothetical protein